MKTFLLAGLSLAFLVGCTSSNPTLPPEVTSYSSPSQPHIGIRHQNHRDVTAGYKKRAVIKPENWRKQNTAPTSWRDQNVEPTPTQEPSS